jgi:hypothetical protein
MMTCLRAALTDCSKNSKFAGHSKMVICKKAKKFRARSHALMRGLDLFADAADRHFSTPCYAFILAGRV